MIESSLHKKGRTIMPDDDRCVRVWCVKCPIETSGDKPHWILKDWSDSRPTPSTLRCQYHQGAEMHLGEPLRKGMVSYEESDQLWAATEPDSYDDARYHRLNDLRLKPK